MTAKNQLAHIDCIRSTSAKPDGAENTSLITLVDQDHRQPDIEMLLPERNYNQCLLEEIRKAPSGALPKQSCVGLFLADPFLHLPSTLADLSEAGVRGIANFPSISFYGATFENQLDGVGFSRKAEFEALAEAQKAGMAVMGCLSVHSAEDCLGVADGLVDPTCWLLHAGLDSLFRSGVARIPFAQPPDGVVGPCFLYDPDVTPESLPSGFTGYARANWW